MKIVQVSQNTPEWLFARAGKITASEADKLLTPLFKQREGQGVETYLYEKLAERALGQPLNLEASTFAMDNGSMAESMALPWFNCQYDCDAKRVGFITTDDERCGCSPDALISDSEGLEIKFLQPQNHLRYLLAGKLPAEFAVQVHFSMFVTGFPRWTFLAWNRRFPSLVVRVQRDEEIQASIKAAVRSFNERFDSAFAQLTKLKEKAA